MENQVITEDLNTEEALQAAYECLSESAPARELAGEETKENQNKNEVLKGLIITRFNKTAMVQEALHSINDLLMVADIDFVHKGIVQIHFSVLLRWKEIPLRCREIYEAFLTMIGINESETRSYLTF